MKGRFRVDWIDTGVNNSPFKLARLVLIFTINPQRQVP